MRIDHLFNKRITALALSGIMVMGLAGCGGSKTSIGGSSSVLSGEIETGDLEGFAGKKVKEYKGYLGYGYNTVDSTVYTEDHINENARILDMKSLATGGFVYSGPMSQISTTYIYETKFIDVLEKISDDNGMTSGDAEFGGVLTELDIDKKDISETETASHMASFIAYASSAVQTGREYIKTKDADQLKDSILEEFKKYVEEHSAEEIVERYGTTVLTDVTLGGRFDMMYYMSELTEDSAEDIQKGINAYVGGVTDDAADELNLKDGAENTGDYVEVPKSKEDKYLDAYNRFKDNCQKSGRVYGGTADIDMISFEESSEAFTNWSKTVADNPVVVGAKPGIPIWEIIATFNKEKARVVQSMFKQEQKQLEEDVKVE